MTLTRISLAALLALTSVPSAHAGYRDVDRHALGLQQLSRELHGEVNAHFRHAAHFYPLKWNSVRMFHLSRRIHELAHHRGSLNLIASDLRRLDQLLHEVEAAIEHIEHDAYLGIGHIHGHIGHVKLLLLKMDHCIDQMRAEVKELRCRLQNPHFGHGGHAPHGGHGPHGGYAAHGGGHAAPFGGHAAHGVGHAAHGVRQLARSGGFGIAFGNSRFQIRIGR